MANGVAEWFGLKRPNFILDPMSDEKFYAPRTGVDILQLIEGLQVNLVTDRPPKRFFWGIYGGGKTHTLFHVISQLKVQIKIDIYPVYVECPSVPRKSTFIHLYHDGIMASMGQDFVVGLFIKLVNKLQVGGEQLISELKNILRDEDLARAIQPLIIADSAKKLSFWRYISGVSVPSRDLAELGQTQSLADTIPSRLANILIIIGRVIKKMMNKTLVLAIDELDRLKSVADEYGISTYEEAFRRLVDENQRDVAILLGCSAANIRELPEPFAGGEKSSAVLSRIGIHNLIEIRDVSANDVDKFIKAILNYIVDKEQAKQKIDELKKSTDETLETDFFPFTNQAIEALKGTLSGIMTPREITQRMSDSAGKAFLMKSPVITREIIGG